MKGQILICDDEPRRGILWKEQLLRLREVEASFDINCATSDDLLEAVHLLEDRRKSARQKKGGYSELSGCMFDEVSVLIVDYDLLRLKGISYLTGESIAYLARCYSRCGVIIAMNQFGENPFDLTLRGHPESFADLNIGSSQIANPGLWSSNSWTTFRPWSWPLIPQLVSALEARVKTLEDCTDQSIVEFLGIPETIVETMPRSTTEFIARSEDSNEATFTSFVSSSGNGLRNKDELFSQVSLARIGAARISTWLESVVLPGQDILIDAPHLVSRFSSLLTGDPEIQESWNQTAMLLGQSKLGIRYRTILRNRFKKSDWLSRPAWYWTEVSNNESIIEVKDPWGAQRYNWRFCEDLSRFLPSEETKEFIAELPSPFIRRFVANPSSPALESGLRKELHRVAYRPTVRFFT
jgi:hypothetical protein